MTQILEQSQIARIPARFRTGDEWWESLGCVPLDRIVFDPWPGTATEADVVRLDDHEDRLCELVDGTLVEKSMGFKESAAAARIIYLLSAFVVPRKLGIITAPDGIMRILAGRIRIPDAAYISFERLPGRAMPTAPIPDLFPDLAVEVISASNTRKEMNIKLAEYFKAGTRLVWYIDPKTRTVDVYTSVETVTLTENDMLTGGDVLAGFETLVSAIFELA